MSVISVILVILVAFIAGMAGILDQWQFHQPIVACTLIGLVTGHLTSGIILGDVYKRQYFRSKLTNDCSCLG